jgi:putative photosynthetic complex assembly protein
MKPHGASAGPDVIPRRAVWVAFAGLALTLGGVAAVRLSGAPIREPDARTVARRELRFADLPDGGIAVIDAHTGATLDVVHGEQGFLRGTLRGLVRERKRRGINSTLPMQLMARADGRLTLQDASTGERIELESFGPSNVAIYARWLELASPAPAGLAMPVMSPALIAVSPPFSSPSQGTP